MKGKFTMIPNSVLDDARLSLQAKAIYALIERRPDTWEFSGRRLARDSSNGFDSHNRAIHELEECGYLVRSKLPSGKTKWILKDPDSENLNQAPSSENPNQAKPNSENPKLGKPQVGKTSTISNTEDKKILKGSKGTRTHGDEFELKSDATTPAQKVSKARAKTVDEVIAYAVEIGATKLDGEFLWDHWESNGWKNGRNSIKDWKATARNWRRQGYLPSQKNPSLIQNGLGSVQSPEVEPGPAGWKRAARKIADASDCPQRLADALRGALQNDAWASLPGNYRDRILNQMKGKP